MQREKRVKQAVKRNLELSREITRRRQEELDSLFAHQRRKHNGIMGNIDDKDDMETGSSVANGSGESSVQGDDGRHLLSRSLSCRRRRSLRYQARRRRSLTFSSFDEVEHEEDVQDQGRQIQDRQKPIFNAKSKSEHKFFPSFINAHAPTDVKFFRYAFPSILFILQPSHTYYGLLLAGPSLYPRVA